MVPWVAGMQFLTNGRCGVEAKHPSPTPGLNPSRPPLPSPSPAFYLPYLVVRSSEEDGVQCYKSDLKPAEALVSESRLLGPVLSTVGVGSVVWGLAARPEFGDLAERSASLVELLSGARQPVRACASGE